MKKAADIRKMVFKWYGDVNIRKSCDELYEKLESKNIASIYEIINDESEMNLLFAKTDIVILTANNYEKKALHQFSFECMNEKIIEMKIVLNGAIDFYRNVSAYSFSIFGYNVFHIHTRVTGAYTNGGAADAVRYILSNKLLLPTTIVSFGICFGTLEDDFDLGDVILSKKVYPYFVGAKVDGLELRVRDDNVFNIDDELGYKIDHLKSNNQFNGLGFKVEFDNYITGEAVVSSAQYRKQYMGTTTQKIVAGDMEGYALFKECKSPPYSVPCIVLKAICDWGIEKNFNTNDKNVISDYYNYVLKSSVEEEFSFTDDVRSVVNSLTDRIQAYAAYNSFVVLKILMESNIFKHSAFYEIENDFVQKKYNGSACSSNGLTRMVNEYIKGYGYTVSDDYIKMVVQLLEKEEVISDIVNNENSYSSVSEIYDVSFSVR